MEEIKVGEYVRTKDGQILKIDSPRDMGYLEEGFPYFKQNIINHSPNIIDLVESEDYVNGEEVDKIRNDGEKYIRTLFNNVYRNKDIESIVTKEQFQNCEYKVEVESC